MDLSAVSAATELLQRAERRAVSTWETALPPKQADTAPGVERISSEGRSVSPAAFALDTPLSAELASAEDRLEIFSQFKPVDISLSADSRLAFLMENQGPAVEAFRLLGVRLRHLRRERPLKKVLITSTIPQEGKSMVSANLACAFATGKQQRVLLLEGDVRRPAISRMFGLGKVPGLCECLQGERSLIPSIYRLEKPGFWILPAGSTSGNPLELLQSGKLSVLMDQLTAWFDWVVIDSPPVLPVADTSVWTRLADGILLVTRQGTTEKRQLQRGLEAVDQKKLIGALLNSSRDSADSDYYYQRETPAIASPAKTSTE